MNGSWEVDKELLPNFLLGIPNLEHVFGVRMENSPLDCLCKGGPTLAQQNHEAAFESVIFRQGQNGREMGAFLKGKSASQDARARRCCP